MDTFYWFRDGQFGEVEAYTWEEAKEAIGNGKFVCDPSDSAMPFQIIDDSGEALHLPRWAIPKEFLVRLVLLGVGI